MQRLAIAHALTGQTSARCTRKKQQNSTCTRQLYIQGHAVCASLLNNTSASSKREKSAKQSMLSRHALFVYEYIAQEKHTKLAGRNCALTIGDIALPSAVFAAYRIKKATGRTPDAHAKFSPQVVTFSSSSSSQGTRQGLQERA